MYTFEGLNDIRFLNPKSESDLDLFWNRETKWIFLLNAVSFFFSLLPRISPLSLLFPQNLSNLQVWMANKGNKGNMLRFAKYN